MNSVCVAIPSIPTRTEQLKRAVSSVLAQDTPVSQIVVSIDNERLGAGANRNKAWQAAQTEWVAFLDDDDELHPNHISTLLRHAEEHPEAGVIFPWYRIVQYGNKDVGSLHPAPGPDADIADLIRNNMDFLPINVLVKKSILEEHGGFHTDAGAGGEDWRLWNHLLSRGIVFSHAPGITWTWHHWGYGMPGQPGNTSGVPHRW